MLRSSQHSQRDSRLGHDGCLVVCFVNRQGRADTGMLDASSRDGLLIYRHQAYYFARDDRVYRAFVERLDRHKDVIQTKLGRRLRWRLNALRRHLEGRSKNYRVRDVYSV